MRVGSLEAELFRRRFDDGLLDLLAGITITGIGLGWILDYAVIAAVLPAIVWPFWLGLHKRLVVPRLGDVEFSPERKARLSGTHRNLLILGVMSFIVGVSAFFYIERTPGAYEALMVRAVMLAPSLVMAVAGLIGYALIGGRRMLLYAIMFVSAGLIGQFGLSLQPGYSLAAGGILPMVIGAAMLVRFLRAFPRQV